MPLNSGTRLGPYEIAVPLGAGGMGEVYRARDTRLGREVAVKVLPQHMSSSAEVRARFEREARTVSSLNHPHICTLHDVGREGDIDYLVMELVEGETLAERLARGALPPAEVLRIGTQIADALERAHRAGVVHRDLKPGNVMLTRAGAKLMDFGLARGGADSGVDPVAPSMTIAVTRTPTLATPLTAAGMIVGTFQYMAPEQLEGKEADARSDIWSLGCVLYEMTTGQRAFGGKSQASLIAAIMNTEPPSLIERAPMTPPALDRLIRQCLAKDPDDRWQSAGDLRRELAWIAQSGPTAATPAAAPAAARAPWLVPAITLAALIAGLVFGWLLQPGVVRRGSPTATGSGAGVVAMARLTDAPGREYAAQLSPDGKMLLYVTPSGGDEDIFLLRVGGENAMNLTESHAGADYDPVFSPDGERIAFGSNREGGGIFVMGATGESPRKLTNEGAGPSWSPDGRRIVYSTERVVSPYGRNFTASLWVVDVASGEKRRIFEGDAVQPVWSPSGRRIAFWATDGGQRDLRTIRADGSDLKHVTRDLPADWGPFWAPDGRSIFFLSDRGGSPDLWRVAVDEGSGNVRGEPEAVTTGVAQVLGGSISADGKRVAISVDEARGEILRTRFDPILARPQGDFERVFASSNPMAQSDLSADGLWLTYRTASPRENIFVMRADGTGRRRLTDDEFRNRGPVWIRGTEWVMFYSNRDGNYAVWLIRSDGTELRKLTDRPYDILQPHVAPDGSRIALSLSGSDLPALGLAKVSDAWFVPGKPPEPIAIDTVTTGLVPSAWSPDGTRIAGLATIPQGTVQAVFSFTNGLLPNRQTPARQGSFGSWLPDSRRLMSWNTPRNTAVIWDIASGSLSDVPGIPGPSELRLSADGRTLVINHTIAEGDVWLLTLQ